jgi:hypothetical protein
MKRILFHTVFVWATPLIKERFDLGRAIFWDLSDYYQSSLTSKAFDADEAEKDFIESTKKKTARKKKAAEDSEEIVFDIQ